jgi:hypothetical protein
MKRNVTWIIVAAGITALVVAVVTGGVWLLNESFPDKPAVTGEQETAEAAQILLDRPSLEDTEAQVQLAVEQIAAAATELVPGMRWEWHRDALASDCPTPYDQTEGQTVNLPFYVSSTPIPDEVWPRYVERVRAIAANFGATAPEVMQDRTASPGSFGNHDVWFSNAADGTTFKVSSQVSAVIAGKVGCRLPRDKFSTPIRATS